MDREAYLKEVAAAFAVWAAACSSLSFVRTDEPKDAHLTITFMGDEEGEIKFDASDGAGGKLAEASEDGVLFDSAERWLLQGQTPRAKTSSYELLPVLIHELGHVFGLEHTTSSTDVMYPYYKASSVTLSAEDVSNINTVYPAAFAASDASTVTAAAAEAETAPAVPAHTEVEASVVSAPAPAPAPAAKTPAPKATKKSKLCNIL